MRVNDPACGVSGNWKLEHLEILGGLDGSEKPWYLSQSSPHGPVPGQIPELFN
jgi:hypothetical protein